MPKLKIKLKYSKQYYSTTPRSSPSSLLPVTIFFFAQQWSLQYIQDKGRKKKALKVIKKKKKKP